jgi:putative transcriptional regulator
MTPQPITHHIDDALLLAYSAGTLPEAFSLAIATHISMFDECRATLESFDAVGGQVMEEQSPVTMNDDAFAKTMAMVGKQSIQLPQPANDIPSVLAGYVGGSLDDVEWRSLGGGIKQKIILTGRDATARLLYIPAGQSAPDHGHSGMELTLVLRGAFKDDSGHYRAGDIEITDDSIEHTPIADMGEDCICLAVTEAPIRFTSIFYRALQPFFKI